MNNFARRPLFRNFAGIGILSIPLLMLAMVPEPAYAGADPMRSVTTVQYDNEHTGWNRNENELDLTTVNPKTFGKLWAAPLTGQILNSPLYVHGVNIGGQQRNVVYVATEDNLIYALDAGNNGAPLWPNPYRLGNPGLQALLGYEDRCRGIGSIGPNIGITGTPVIDLDTGTLYAVGLTCSDDPCVRASTMVFEMAAVDITTGLSRPGWPVPVEPPLDPPIDTRVTENRGALLLANDRVYVPFGGYSGDCGPYHGWVVSVDKLDPTAPQIAYRTPGTDIHRGSGIWASGGIAADAAGDIYPATGNSFQAPDVDYSNAVLRLNGQSLAFSEQEPDFFMPSNWRNLNSTDDDLGSSAPMLLPPQEGSNTPNMIFVAGKRGVGHLLNRDDLGGVSSGDGENGEGVYSERISTQGGVFSTAAYYEDPDSDLGHIIFSAIRGNNPVCLRNRVVVAFKLNLDADGNSSYQTAWCTPSMGQPTSPVVTSAPGKTGILWVVDRTGGVLHAFNAATGMELYSSDMVEGDQLGPTRNFLHFTVIDGKVFVGNSANNVVAYGRVDRNR